MNQQVFPTKGNLLKTKKSLELARMGFDLMDRKRNILVREMMLLMDKAAEIQDQIDQTYAQAYLALQKANITLGIGEEVAKTVPVERGLELDFRSVMGVEIPTLFLKEQEQRIGYGLSNSNSLLDLAHIRFEEVKQLTVKLAEVENSVYRLADAIKKTQKRANALKNIVIPNFTQTIRFINDSLDEKEREDFARLKVIKRQSS